MPESPLDVQIRTLRQIAQASPAARDEATRLADSLEAETIGNRREAAHGAFQAISPRYVGQQPAPAGRTAAVSGLNEQLGAAYSVPDAQLDRLRMAQAEGRSAGAEQGPVGGALSGLEATGTRLLGGIMQRSKDSGTTWYDPYLEALPEAQANVEQRVAAAPVSATVGQAAPYLGAAMLGGPGVALLTGTEAVSSYGEGRQMGLDPNEASKRAAGQALLTAGGMRLTPFSRAAAASNAANAGRRLLAREALEVGAGTLDALPQSAVMDVGGGAADVMQARNLGLAGGELERSGKERMATLPTAPELLLADLSAELLMSPLRVRGHRVATRHEQAQIAHERGSLLDAQRLIDSQRIADNQADLERMAGDDAAQSSLLRMTPAEAPPMPLPGGQVEAPLPVAPSRVEQRASTRQQMGMPDLDAGLAPLLRLNPELGEPLTPIDRRIVQAGQADVDAAIQQRVGQPDWTPREWASVQGTRGRRKQLEEAAADLPPGVETPRLPPVQQMPESAASVRSVRIDSSDEARYQNAVEKVAQSKKIKQLRTKAAAAAKKLKLDESGRRRLELDAAAVWRARRDAEQARPAPIPAETTPSPTPVNVPAVEAVKPIPVTPEVIRESNRPVPREVAPPPMAESRVSPPAPQPTDAPAKPVEPTPVAPSEQRFGKLSDDLHQRLVTDAATVKGVRVERDAEKGTHLRFEGTEATVPVVLDTRPVGERDARSWLESAVASGRQESVADVATLVAEAARKLDLPPPTWTAKAGKLTPETLRDNWNRLLKQKDGDRIARQAMEDMPVAAVVLPSGAVAGAEHVIGLTKHYQGTSLREETWHIGWQVLPDALKHEVIRRLPEQQRSAAQRSPRAATEAATYLLDRLWKDHVARGAKPRSWFGRIVAAMRERLGKLLPFMAPKTDRVRELAQEFGEGKVFKRLDAPKETAGTPEAESLHRDARRAMAAQTDEGRNVWKEVDDQAEAIIRDGDALNRMIAKFDNPAGLRDATQAELRALNILAEEAGNRGMLAAAGAMRDPTSKQRKLDDELLDMAAWEVLRLQANRDAGQRLNLLRNDANAPPLAKILAPFTEMSGSWKQKAARARTRAAKRQVAKDWQAWRDRILTKLKARGFDLSDPATLADINGMEADSLANMRFEIAQEIKRSRTVQERIDDFSMGRLASELTMRNLMTIKSWIPQIPTAVYYGLRGQVRAGVEQFGKTVDGLDPELLAGFGGRAEASKHFGQALLNGIRFGFESVLTGDSIAKGRLTGKVGYGEDVRGGEVVGGQEYVSVLQDLGDISKVPGLGAALRIGTGPGLEAIRFIDDVTWTTTFEMTRRTLAAARAKIQGGDLMDYVQDQAIVEDATNHADRVTQRSRPDPKTAAGVVFRSIEGLRSPTFGGALTKRYIGPGRFVLYNPLMHIMPVFRTVAMLTIEAGRVLSAPVRGGQAAFGSRRMLQNPEAMRSHALEDGVTVAQLRRKLTDEYLEQMTDFVVGSLGYALAGVLGQSLLPAPRGEQEDYAEERGKELLTPTGETPIGNLQRMSPVYETAMGAAAIREAVKAIADKPSWDVGKQEVFKMFTGIGRAVLEKPLLSSTKALVDTPHDPVTGEAQSVPDYLERQATQQIFGFGKPYRDLQRSFDTTQSRTADPSQVMGVTEKRVQSYGLTGETRSAPGFIERGLFGNTPRAAGNERRVLELVNQLNTALDEKTAKEAPPGTRPKGGAGGWWPGALNKDMPSDEDRRFVERMTVPQQEELNRIAGERWWKMLGPQLSRIEKIGTTDPKAALTIMQRTRSAAARAARYEVARSVTTK